MTGLSWIYPFIGILSGSSVSAPPSDILFYFFFFLLSLIMKSCFILEVEAVVAVALILTAVAVTPEFELCPIL